MDTPIIWWLKSGNTCQDNGSGHYAETLDQSKWMRLMESVENFNRSELKNPRQWDEGHHRCWLSQWVVEFHKRSQSCVTATWMHCSMSQVMTPTWPRVHEVGLTSPIWHQPRRAGHADRFWAHRLDPADVQCTPIKKASCVKISKQKISMHWFENQFNTYKLSINGCYAEAAWKHLRLCRSKSSVSKSKRGCWTSEGPWDWRTEDEEEMTVVWPEGWIVLNWNWGPIQRRRWGPVWVTISTLGGKDRGSDFRN